MYTKHHTRGIVLGKHDNGEADRTYALLTPDLGKVYAQAHGIRNGHGRNKGALQTLSIASVSLVRGKSGWKITNASSEHSFYTKLATEKAKLAVLVRVLKLVRRMLAGEGSAHGVFAAVESFADVLCHGHAETSAKGGTSDLLFKDVRTLELLTVVRILHMLGYVKDDERLNEFFKDASDVSVDMRTAFAPHEHLALTVVNEALSASQL
jgi:recombinational DNA repair protein (RecF pathway)